MSDIEDLQNRLVAALDRISGGLDAAAGGSSEVDTDALQRDLEEERTVNAQLKERIRKLSEQQDKGGEADAATAQRIEALDVELQRLRQANEQLRASNAALREANEAGVGEPHLINKAMLAELESLRAARSADVAEANAILGAMDAVLKGEAVDA
jgi:predicted  nucleic acid-binding Zn-ribbon protein